MVPGAWITTGGMHAGVMKHVGEAVQEYMIAHGLKTKVFCIGIAPWGCVQNKELLVDPKVSRQRHWQFFMEAVFVTQQYLLKTEMKYCQAFSLFLISIKTGVKKALLFNCEICLRKT